MIAVYNTSKGIAAIVSAPHGIITEDVIERAVPTGIDYILLDETDPQLVGFLADATYRDAWQVVAGQLVIDKAARRRIYGR